MDDDWVPVQGNPQMEIWKPGVKMLEVTSGTWDGFYLEVMLGFHVEKWQVNQAT